MILQGKVPSIWATHRPKWEPRVCPNKENLEPGRDHYSSMLYTEWLLINTRNPIQQQSWAVQGLELFLAHFKIIAVIFCLGGELLHSVGGKNRGNMAKALLSHDCSGLLIYTGSILHCIWLYPYNFIYSCYLVTLRKIPNTNVWLFWQVVIHPQQLNTQEGLKQVCQNSLVMRSRFNINGTSLGWVMHVINLGHRQTQLRIYF